MESMHRDFLRMLQGALTIKDGDVVSHFDSSHEDGKPGVAHSDKLKARTSAGHEVYISLKDYVVKQLEAEVEDKSDQGSGVRRTESLGRGSASGRPAGKLIPDIDFDRVLLNKQQQFDEFLKMWSIFNFPEQLGADPKRGSARVGRKGSTPQRQSTVAAKSSSQEVVKPRAAPTPPPASQGEPSQVNQSNQQLRLGGAAFNALNRFDSDSDEQIMSWRTQIQPYVQTLNEKAFNSYKTWQATQIKEFTKRFDDRLSGAMMRFETKIKELEEHVSFLQSETHTLLRVQEELQDRGVISGDAIRRRKNERSPNTEAVMEGSQDVTRRVDQLITDLNNISVLAACYQNEITNLLGDFGSHFQMIRDLQISNCQLS